MKQLFIIAGPNGAGKTTASYIILPEVLKCNEFVNADEIAKGLSPFNPESVSIQAGRLMLERINQMIKEGKSFAFETTLATRSYVGFIERAKKKGYFVSLIFLYLPSAEQAVERVAMRVKEGGHNIAPDVIVRRYKRGLENLVKLYLPICDSWIIYNNYDFNKRISIIAEGRLLNLPEVYDKTVYNKIISND
ncbi:MAG: zeta toxin family protein [Paludibacteraceae bacterium]|nr:zeta toxin family protein [Paludibacteraceae bacterium]